MPAYTQTSTQIISSAYQLIQVNTPNNSPDPSQLDIGIDQLNKILSTLEVGDMGVPFYDEITFTTIANQPKYEFSLEDTADVETKPFTFLEWIVRVQNNTRIPIKIQSRQQFKNSYKPTNNFGYPYFCILDDQQNKSFIEFYPVPNGGYTINFAVKKVFDRVLIGESLGDMPPDYYEYLEMRLAQKLALRFPTAVWGDDHRGLLSDLITKIKAKNKKDLSVQLVPIIGGYGYRQGWNYGGIP